MEEALKDLTADFVTEQAYQNCLATLFQMPKGEWISLATLCQNVPLFPTTVAIHHLPLEIPEEIFVTWLEHPWNNEHDDFVIINFFCDRTLFHNVAIYNRHLFWQRYQG